MDIGKIQREMEKIEKLKEEIKASKELIKDQLDDNAEYAEANKKGKEIASKKKRLKEEILAKPENEKVVWDIKENQEEIKVSEEILAGELVEYYQSAKTDRIEDANGESRKFKISVKILPKNSRFEEE